MASSGSGSSSTGQGQEKKHDYEENPEYYVPIEITKHYDHRTIDFAIDNFDKRITALEMLHGYNNSIAASLKKTRLKLDRMIPKGDKTEKGGTGNASGNTRQVAATTGNSTSKKSSSSSSSSSSSKSANGIRSNSGGSGGRYTY